MPSWKFCDFRSHFKRFSGSGDQIISGKLYRMALIVIPEFSGSGNQFSGNFAEISRTTFGNFYPATPEVITEGFPVVFPAEFSRNHLSSSSSNIPCGSFRKNTRNYHRATTQLIPELFFSETSLSLSLSRF